MNLSRKLCVAEIFNTFYPTKRTWFECRYFLPCVTVVVKGIHSSTVACVNQVVLDRVEREWKRKLNNVKERGDAIFVLGPMGAGKSTIIENCFKYHLKYKSYAYVDTDAIMGTIDAFTADKVEIYYPLARKIAISLTDWILMQNISFVAEGTCVKVEELIEYMERLKETGYKIHVNCLPPVSLNEILHRSKHRKNRIIHDDVVTSIYTHATIGLKKLYEYNKTVDYKLFSELEISTGS
ncbi:uncharacterized protein LOC114523585 [Dendronephthya gigantea]|uniref:uncharacterized protein LOC114523585 n=1 Tax=Dendronephthya gigantea TaxID=151771 RepID=UPI001068DDBC|nr:uncharacterized protein LOC114523585 [Dendronephthya gigantea]